MVGNFKQKKSLYKPNLWDFLLAVIILTVSMSTLMMKKENDSLKNKKAMIFKNNQLVKELDLFRDGVFLLNNMRFVYEKGRIKISESDCPKKICVHTGWISQPNQIIVCVPNQVLVEISGAPSESNINAVSY